MDGDYLEGRRRYVEVCEPGILQMMKVTLRQSVPEVENAELLKNYKLNHEAYLCIRGKRPRGDI